MYRRTSFPYKETFSFKKILVRLEGMSDILKAAAPGQTPLCHLHINKEMLAVLLHAILEPVSGTNCAFNLYQFCAIKKGIIQLWVSVSLSKSEYGNCLRLDKTPTVPHAYILIHYI